MLEQKLINTDGLDKMWGLHLVWFDGFSYQLTPIDSTDAEDIRESCPHWIVYLTGDIQEDCNEIERQTFLSGEAYDKCLCDIGLVEENDTIDGTDFKIYLQVTDDLKPHEHWVLKEHEHVENDYICVYAVDEPNKTKVDKIIAGALVNGYDLETAVIWVMKLGYMAQDRLQKQFADIASTVESWTV